MSTTTPPAPPTINDLLALVNLLPGENDDLSAKTQASHDALENVTTVTDTEQAAVDAAVAHQTQAVNSAKADADTAVAATEASRQALDATIDQIVAMASALKK